MQRRRVSARTALAQGAVAWGALALAGCADMQPNGPGPTSGGGPYYGPSPYSAPPPPPRREPPGFSPQEFAWSEGAGSGALGGRVAYRAQSGERWVCAGQTIALIPAARYSGERMRVLYGSDSRAVVPAAEVRTRNAAQPGVDYGRWVKTAACDSHDGFRFAGLQPGPYFLIARARPKGREAGPGEGVVIMQRVDIAPGPTRIVVPQG